jgi:hypothetical protein
MKAKHILALTILLTMLATATTTFAQANAPASFSSLKELIDVLPHPLVQQLKITAKIEDARQQANALFKQNAVGKTATMKVRALGRGRTAGCPAAPAQIPASGITAPGSCIRW